MFTAVGDYLRETATTPAQRAALYEVAAGIDGVELLGDVTDHAGRTGTAVAIDDPEQGVRHTLVFDPDTGVLLEERRRDAGRQRIRLRRGRHHRARHVPREPHRRRDPASLIGRAYRRRSAGRRR